MMNKFLRNFSVAVVIWSGLFISCRTAAHAGDDPLLLHVMIDQLEWQNADAGQPDSYSLEADAWLGKDLHKLWLKTEVEYLDGNTEAAEIQALYSRAITPYWDLQIGARRDSKPAPTQDWGVIGIQGLAPYFYDIEAALFVGDSGTTAARISVEYELLFTQQWILSPEVSFNFYGQNNAETMTGSGLSDIEMGLRLRYEIRREFAPYIGINWHKKFGTTADFARSHEEQISDTQWVAGIHAWF